MLYSIKIREDLEKLNEFVLLENQVRGLRIQDELGKQNLHVDKKNLFEPVTDTIRITHEDLTKTMMLTSKGSPKHQRY